MRSAGEPVNIMRSLALRSLLIAGIALAGAPAAAQAVSPGLEAAVRSASRSDRDLRAFYAGRDNRPLWFDGAQRSPAADALWRLIGTAELDGLDPEDFDPRALSSAIERAEGGSPRSVARADVALSRAFWRYASASRRPRDVGTLYLDRELSPKPPTALALLNAAADAPSLAAHISGMRWLNPLYADLRRGLATAQDRNAPIAAQNPAALIRLNMERARVLSNDRARRHILVDAASARLWMYEDGRAIDSMKVVVGKPDQQTPMLAGLLHYALVNPYWNVPPDLARTKVAPGVVKSGVKYLKAQRYEVMSDWTDAAKVVDPKSIDWRAVAAGRTEIRVRQLPGRGNSMGRMKFMMPNDLGIYLHDTPDRKLFSEATRTFSSGCVRLEDAPRLARWLFGKPLAVPARTAEQRVDLPEPVPVYITYLTASPSPNGIAFLPDVYGRDAPGVGPPARRAAQVARAR